jgi:hypothetical protein
VRLVPVTVAVLLVLAASVQGKDKDAALIGDNYYAAGYVSGPRFGKVIRACSLALEADALHITDATYDYGRWVVKHHQVTTLFTIPWTIIKSVSGAIEREDEHGAATLLLGWQHQEKNQDYVTITTETPTGAEVFVFAVGPHQSAAIVAKIQFAVKRAQAVTAP